MNHIRLPVTLGSWWIRRGRAHRIRFYWKCKVEAHQIPHTSLHLKSLGRWGSHLQSYLTPAAIARIAVIKLPFFEKSVKDSAKFIFFLTERTAAGTAPISYIKKKLFIFIFGKELNKHRSETHVSNPSVWIKYLIKPKIAHPAQLDETLAGRLWGCQARLLWLRFARNEIRKAKFSFQKYLSDCSTLLTGATSAETNK